MLNWGCQWFKSPHYEWKLILLSLEDVATRVSMVVMMQALLLREVLPDVTEIYLLVVVIRDRLVRGRLKLQQIKMCLSL